MKALLGIDIAKRSHQVALLYGSVLRRKSIRNSASGFKALTRWLDQCELDFEQLHACMEATSTYHEALAEYLVSQGYRVSVVNPARIKAFAKSKLQRAKSDPADARLIAQFCLEQNPEPWTPLPDEIKRLRALMRHLEVLKGERGQLENRRQAAGDASVKASFDQLIKATDKQIAHTERLIEEHVDDNDELKQQQRLLCSIPGVGLLTALHLLAEVPPNIWASSARRLAAFAGLTPQIVSSGESVRGRSRLCKLGHAKLRKQLYMPALSAKRYNPTLKAFAERLSQNGKTNMVVIGALMRKLLHQAFGVMKHQQPFDPNWQTKPVLVA